MSSKLHFLTNRENTRISYESVFHDMKTPIAIMYLNIQLLEKEIDYNGSIKGSIASIRKNCLRIIKMINDVTDSEKMSNGKLTPCIKNWDVITVLRDVVESSSYLSVRDDVSIKFLSNVNQKVMAIDKEFLERIVFNILSNAYKFTNKGGSIEVSVYDIDEFLVLKIRDSGDGISPKIINNLFKKYETVVNNKNTRGTGLGLYIVKQLVDVLGGSICIRNTLEGTEATIIFRSYQIEEDGIEKSVEDDFYANNLGLIEFADENVAFF